MSDLTDEAVKALLDGATPGPWAYEPHGDTGDYGVGVCYAMSDIELAFPLSGQVDSDVMVYDPICPEVAGQGNAAIMAAAPDLARALLDARADAQAAVADIVRSVWGRCEALEDEAADKLAQLEKLTDHEMGFWRGQKTVAKSIRRSTEMPTAEAIAIRRAEGGKA